MLLGIFLTSKQQDGRQKTHSLVHKEFGGFLLFESAGGQDSRLQFYPWQMTFCTATVLQILKLFGLQRKTTLPLGCVDRS
jgi:hypothetical protein